jgi:hypothetical protein
MKLAKEGEVSILRKNIEKVRVSAMISMVSLIPLFRRLETTPLS